jgi:hypothetical protein
LPSLSCRTRPLEQPTATTERTANTWTREKGEGKKENARNTQDCGDDGEAVASTSTEGA